MPEAAICTVEDCKLTVDIVLKSSDGQLLGAHQRNLEMYTEGFPIAGSTLAIVSDPVCLEETAEVLHLMLQYTHNIRLPCLDTIPFTLVASLAEAVEKYLIYSAMEICKVKMMHATNDHPNEVFMYSVKHNYPDLTEMAAKSTLNNSASTFLALIREAGLPDDVAFRWLRYRNSRMEILVQLPTAVSDSESHKKPGSGNCKRWKQFKLRVFDEVKRDMSTLDRFFDIVQKHQSTLHNCSICCSCSDLWELQVAEQVENLPSYWEA